MRILKYIVPGLVIQAVLVGGGYATGRELVRNARRIWCAHFSALARNLVARSRMLPIMRKACVLSIAFLPAFGAASGSSPVVVPLRLVGHSPIVVANIEGMDVPLVFDSGDQSTVALQQSVLDHIKAIPTGESYKMRFAKGKVVESPAFRVPRLQIGGAVFTEVIGRLDVHDPSYRAADVGQKGFLGTGLFKSYEVVLDYRHRKMILVPRVNNERASGSCQGTAVPFSSAWRGEPVTEADTDLGRVTVWWDTGTPVSVLSERYAHAARPHLSEDAVTTRRFTLGGTEFGPWRFEIWDISLPPGFNGSIGYDFFANHVVCIDFPDKQIVIPR